MTNYLQKYAVWTALGQNFPYQTVDAILDVLNGFTSTGTYISPYTFLITKNTDGGVDYYSANNAYQTIYGGSTGASHHAGGVDGAKYYDVCQAALNALATTGGEVVHTKGRFDFAEATDPFFVPSNVWVHGCGWATNIHQTVPNFYGAIFSLAKDEPDLNTCDLNENIRVSDMFFDADAGIAANARSNCVSYHCVDKVWIDNIYGSGMNQVVESHGRSTNVSIQKIYGYNTYYGTVYSYPTYGTLTDLHDIHVDGVISNINGTNTIGLAGKYVTLCNAKIYAPTTYGVVLRGEDLTAFNVEVHSPEYGFAAIIDPHTVNSKRIYFDSCRSYTADKAGFLFDHVNQSGAINNCLAYNSSNGGASYQSYRILDCDYITIKNSRSIDDNGVQKISYDVLANTSDHMYVLDNDFLLGKKAIAVSLAHQKIKGNLGIYDENSGTSTGTGAEQTIPHGLYTTPNRVWFSNIETGADPYQSTAVDATNIYVTATVDADYAWKAERKDTNW